jgi:AraC-like DNA-binding protein
MQAGVKRSRRVARLPIRQLAFDDPRLRAVADYLLHHISDSPRLSYRKAAGIAAYCPEHFSRMFHERTGVRFVDWQCAVRMEHAKPKLLLDRMQLGAVGRAVGYQHLSTFGRVFKRYEGVTPLRFRAFGRAHPEMRTMLTSASWPKLVFSVVALNEVQPCFAPLLTAIADRLGATDLDARRAKDQQASKTS